MSHIILAATKPLADDRTSRAASASLVRAMLLITVVAAAVAGLAATGPLATARAVAGSGEDLTRLLRFMALLKAAMALATLSAVVWRLGAPTTLPRLAAYALASAAMAAGPGLIWCMAHVALGALLLHGGLIVALVMLWRDPAVSARLTALLEARTAARR